MRRVCLYQEKKKFAIRNETSRVIQRIAGRRKRDLDGTPLRSEDGELLTVLSESSPELTFSPPASAHPSDAGQCVLDFSSPETGGRTTDTGTSSEDDSSDSLASVYSSPSPREVDNVATLYFMDVYSVDGPSARYLDYACEIIAKGSDETGALMPAVRAVGLASLANRTGQAGLMQKSRLYYAMTLKQINNAVRDPRLVHRDSTVVSILVASLFETVTWSESSMVSWSAHMAGIAALIAGRGEEQFSAPNGLMIFQEAVGHMLTASVVPCPGLCRTMTFLTMTFADIPRCAFTPAKSHIPPCICCYAIYWSSSHPVSMNSHRFF